MTIRGRARAATGVVTVLLMTAGSAPVIVSFHGGALMEGDTSEQTFVVRTRRYSTSG